MYCFARRQRLQNLIFYFGSLDYTIHICMYIQNKILFFIYYYYIFAVDTSFARNYCKTFMVFEIVILYCSDKMLNNRSLQVVIGNQINNQRKLNNEVPKG